LDAAWERLCRPFKKSPKVVADTYLLAFAATGDYQLVTLDRALTQFENVDVELI